jgi:lipid-binding SYLF domain-containing protein
MRLLSGLLLAALVSAPAFAQKTPAERLVAATEDLKEMMNASDKGIPQDLLNKASCLIIVPNLKAGGFIVGAQYGKGFFTCRRASGVGWHAPGSIKLEGGKFGFLAGAKETDVIMLVMNHSGMEHLLSDKFQIGGEASGAAGPIGRDSTAMTDAEMHAEILSYSRSRGIFGGIDINGSAITTDADTNMELYGKKMSNREISETKMPVPAAAKPLIHELNMLSSRK